MVEMWHTVEVREFHSAGIILTDILLLLFSLSGSISSNSA